MKNSPRESPPQLAARAPAAASLRAAFDVRLFLLLLLAAPWALAATLPLIHIDDPGYIWRNPALQHGLSRDSIHWALTTTLGAFYFPVTWLSLLLDVTLFGPPGPPPAPAAGMHMTNVVFHVAATYMLYAFLRTTTGSPWRSFLVAAVFMIHPLRVESVAWVTERKDVLSTFFGLAALLAYVRYIRAADGRRHAWYAGMCVLFALSLLSKPMLVTLPPLLLLLDVWPLRRAPWPGVQNRIPWKTLILEKAPLLALTLAISAITLWIQQQAGSLGSTANFPPGYRLANAAIAILLYLRDTFYFFNLSVFYPPYKAIPADVALLAAVVLTAATALAIWLARKPRQNAGDDRLAALIGWLWFLGTLIPVLGIFQSGVQSRADRFTYWPSIGLLMALVYPLPAAWFQRIDRQKITALLTSAMLLLLAFNTTTRLLLWRDPLALYLDSVANTQHNGWLKCIVANVYQDAGDLQEAEKWYRSSLDDMSNMWEPHYNFGILLRRQERWDDAAFHFELALRMKPNDPATRAAYESARLMARASQTQPR